MDPTKCRAFEDGESGLLAAYRAGMQVIDVTGNEENAIFARQFILNVFKLPRQARDKHGKS